MMDVPYLKDDTVKYIFLCTTHDSRLYLVVERR